MHATGSKSAIEVVSPGDTTTIVRGPTVLLTTNDGESRPGALLGLFDCDERVLSRIEVRVDGERVEVLDHARTGASSARISLLASVDSYRNAQMLLVRRQSVKVGCLREQLEVHSFSSTRQATLEVTLESDCASVLALKSGQAVLPDALGWTVSEGGFQASAFQGGSPFVTVSIGSATIGSPNGSAPASDGGAGAGSVAGSVVVGNNCVRLIWTVDLVPGRLWTAEWNATTRTHNTHLVEPLKLPRLQINGDDYRWAKAISSSIDDLEALVIDGSPGGTLAGHRFIAAGAPWYLALFGRDSLIAAWQSLPLGPDLAFDVLEILAALQGTVHDERTQQAPGKILHERRIGRPQVFGMTEGTSYFGSVDASALFVMLLAETYRWGGDVTRVAALLPAARRAIAWCLGEARRSGSDEESHFLWYRSDKRGLGNQGWKDSGDCMVRGNGNLASGPFAVAEAQAYLFEALHGLARLERDLGAPDAANSLEADAAALSAQFEARFVLRGELIALALDGEQQPLDVPTSNMGQGLWSGILRPEVAKKIATRTMRADLLSQWGIRTLGEGTRAYNPLGYHLGTVWAHDTALVIAGMARHGERQSVQILVDCLLKACEAFGWRLPELYGGLNTADDGRPLPYPAACSPQAWSAGSPLLMLRSVLGLSPDVPAGIVTVRPMLADGERLQVGGLRIGSRLVAFDVCGSTVRSVEGLDGLKLVC